MLEQSGPDFQNAQAPDVAVMKKTKSTGALITLNCGHFAQTGPRSFPACQIPDAPSRRCHGQRRAPLPKPAFSSVPGH